VLVGAWGPGVYQNDDALDLRDRWRGLVGAGFDPQDVGRRLISELGLGDDADDAPSWLALADLLWGAGRLTGDVRKRALRIVRDVGDLQRWDEAHRRARARVLAQVGHRLLSRMPRPRPIRPRHPCDWKPGEVIVWRMVDGGSATLRVVGFDPKWGAGGSPIVELVGTTGAGGKAAPADAEGAKARTVVHSLKLTSGRPWQGTRFKIGVFEPGTYSARRVRRIRPSARPARFAKNAVAPVGIRWSGLDDFLLAGFELPWPRGTILRVPAAGSPTWLVVVDVTSRGGAPAIVCEILDWRTASDPSAADLRRIDVHRTADTVQLVRDRVVDPRNRLSVAKMKQHLGVRDAKERAPFRVTIAGYCPEGVKAVGRRRVVVPTSGANVVAWEALETIAERLRSGARQPAMDDLDPAPWG
jgi:hypothetical protein